MMNITRIRKMKPKELAPMLVHEIVEPDYDYDYDENIYRCGDIYSYETPDGQRFCDEDDAVEYTIEWLLSETGTVIYGER